jgi:hypothetical protein
MEAAHPSLFLRYGSEGKRRCTEDTIYHVLHLAAALEVMIPGSSAGIVPGSLSC